MAIGGSAKSPSSPQAYCRLIAAMKQMVFADFIFGIQLPTRVPTDPIGRIRPNPFGPSMVVRRERRPKYRFQTQAGIGAELSVHSSMPPGERTTNQHFVDAVELDASSTLHSGICGEPRKLHHLSTCRG